MRLAGRSGISSFARGLFLVFPLGLVGLVASANNVGCIPDPEGDYNDFKARTAHLGNNETSLDASFDSKPPEAAVEGLYAGICATVLAAKDPEQALRFYTETKYTPDGEGSSTGKLTLTVTPMVGWDFGSGQYISPATVSKSETRGASITIPDMPVTAGGRFTAALGTVNLAKEANSVSGRDAVIENTVLDGLFSAGDRFCATLGGQLTVPYGLALNASDNICIFQKVNEGDPLPKIPSAEFACNF
ncbi:MAG TPA: hypothetical protein VM580_29545 [Labilithrix sp.]|jgi:hypothetical protein|nr:hypothetical protein [Labilithrix sp.]